MQQPLTPKPAGTAVCAVFRDEAPYLAEWVEFHRLVGVEHFFLYDDRSRDAGREVLAPYVSEGLVTLRVSVSRLRINHYAVRSRQEFAEKLARHAAADSTADGTSRLQRGYFAYHDRNEVNDPILLSYAPQVRERMARRRS